ncbi:MAG: T9SS C-terminal target domain-containing protein, partial [Chloroflexi bacterium]
FSESDEALLCPDRILFCEGLLTADWDKQRDYFLAVADTASDDALRLAVRSSAAWCLVELGLPDSAQAELIALMDSTTDQFDLQRLALEQLFAELHETGLDTLITGFAAGSGDTLVAALERAEQMLMGSRPEKPVMPRVIPTRFALHQNYPNPFNPTTEIRFDLPEAAKVELTIYNTMGQHVATLIDEVRPAGAHRLTWDSRTATGSLATGMYIYQLKAGSFTDTKKMLLLK